MSEIEYIARGVIEYNGRFLLARGKGRDNWYLPGGHIEIGESAEYALLRELDEELGATGFITKFRGAAENKFQMKGSTVQEINLVFDVELDDPENIENREEHLEFGWFTKEEIKNLLVFPLSLRDALFFSKDTTPVWTSEGFEL